MIGKANSKIWITKEEWDAHKAYEQQIHNKLVKDIITRKSLPWLLRMLGFKYRWKSKVLSKPKQVENGSYMYTIQIIEVHIVLFNIVFKKINLLSNEP